MWREQGDTCGKAARRGCGLLEGATRFDVVAQTSGGGAAGTGGPVAGWGVGALDAHHPHSSRTHAGAIPMRGRTQWTPAAPQGGKPDLQTVWRGVPHVPRHEHTQPPPLKHFILKVRQQ